MCDGGSLTPQMGSQLVRAKRTEMVDLQLEVTTMWHSCAANSKTHDTTLLFCVRHASMTLDDDATRFEPDRGKASVSGSKRHRQSLCKGCSILATPFYIRRKPRKNIVWPVHVLASQPAVVH